MSWNHRVCAKKCNQDEEVLFSVRSVYYDKDGNPDAFSNTPETLGSFEDIEGLEWTIDMIKKAFEKPVIDLDNFPNEYKS